MIPGQQPQTNFANVANRSNAEVPNQSNVFRYPSGNGVQHNSVEVIERPCYHLARSNSSFNNADEFQRSQVMGMIVETSQSMGNQQLQMQNQLISGGQGRGQGQCSMYQPQAAWYQPAAPQQQGRTVKNLESINQVQSIVNNSIEQDGFAKALSQNDIGRQTALLQPAQQHASFGLPSHPHTHSHTELLQPIISQSHSSDVVPQVRNPSEDGVLKTQQYLAKHNTTAKVQDQGNKQLQQQLFTQQLLKQQQQDTLDVSLPYSSQTMLSKMWPSQYQPPKQNLVYNLPANVQPGRNINGSPRAPLNVAAGSVGPDASLLPKNPPRDNLANPGIELMTGTPGYNLGMQYSIITPVNMQHSNNGSLNSGVPNNSILHSGGEAGLIGCAGLSAVTDVNDLKTIEQQLARKNSQEKNRIAQQRFRQKQRNLLQERQRSITSLKEQINSIQADNQRQRVINQGELKDLYERDRREFRRLTKPDPSSYAVIGDICSVKPELLDVKLTISLCVKPQFLQDKDFVTVQQVHELSDRDIKLLYELYMQQLKHHCPLDGISKDVKSEPNDNRGRVISKESEEQVNKLVNELLDIFYYCRNFYRVVQQAHVVKDKTKEPMCDQDIVTALNVSQEQLQSVYHEYTLKMGERHVLHDSIAEQRQHVPVRQATDSVKVRLTAQHVTQHKIMKTIYGLLIAEQDIVSDFPKNIWLKRLTPIQYAKASQLCWPRAPDTWQLSYAMALIAYQQSSNLFKPYPLISFASQNRSSESRLADCDYAAQASSDVYGNCC